MFTIHTLMLISLPPEELKPHLKKIGSWPNSLVSNIIAQVTWQDSHSSSDQVTLTNSYQSMVTSILQDYMLTKDNY
jgi:hypothetical protein